MKEVKASNTGGISLRAEAKKDLATLKSMLSPEKEFSSVAKAALLKTGDEMAKSILASHY